MLVRKEIFGKERNIGKENVFIINRVICKV